MDGFAHSEHDVIDAESVLELEGKEKRFELLDEAEVDEPCRRIHGATEAGVGVGGEAERKLICDTRTRHQPNGFASKGRVDWSGVP